MKSPTLALSEEVQQAIQALNFEHTRHIYWSQNECVCLEGFLPPATESRSTRSHRKPRQVQGPPRWARRPRGVVGTRRGTLCVHAITAALWHADSSPHGPLPWAHRRQW
jgi:hypothetical protein